MGRPAILLAVGVVALAVLVPEAAPAAPAGSVAQGTSTAAGRHRLALGMTHTCVIADDGSVWCWGNGFTARTPVDLGPGRVVALAAGGFHACAVFADGSLQCWGGNGTGELGHGNTTNLGDARRPGGAPRVFFGRSRTVVQVEAGTGTTCALLDDATVRCWGYGGAGALGLGNDESIGDDELPVTVPTVVLGGPARAIALGAYHSCALLEDGTVRCWGPNGRGELGSGDTVPIGDAATPDQGRPVALDGRAIDIASGGYQTCVLLENGTLSCWGPQDVGPLIGVALH